MSDLQITLDNIRKHHQKRLAECDWSRMPLILKQLQNESIEAFVKELEVKVRLEKIWEVVPAAFKAYLETKKELKIDDDR